MRLSLQSLNCYVIRDALLNDEADVGVFYRVGNDDALNRRELGEATAGAGGFTANCRCRFY
ncbi:putative transcriptional regulator LYSR-type [Escherichia coli H588]|nr:putative transcriptional regulator LYSR-type [Escherichia coli H588]